MVKQRLCKSCRDWYDAKESWCPVCGEETPPSNKALATAKLNNHLFSMASKAESERGL